LWAYNGEGFSIGDRAKMLARLNIFDEVVASMLVIGVMRSFSLLE